MKNLVLNFFKKVIVFNPNNLTLIIWNIFVFFITLFEVYTFPLKITFEWTFLDNATLKLLFIIPFFTFLADIVIELNTAFFENGTVNSKRKTIFLNYSRNRMKVDIITNLGMFLGEIFGQPWVFGFELLRLF